MAKIAETAAPSRNTLGCGTKLKGDIESNGDFRIDGTLMVQSKPKEKWLSVQLEWLKEKLFVKMPTLRDP